MVRRFPLNPGCTLSLTKSTRRPQRCVCTLVFMVAIVILHCAQAGESSDALRVCTMFSQISAFALPSPFYYIASPSGGSITRSPSLHPDFQVGVDGLLRQLSGTPAKIVSGEELTGPRMAALMRAWVSSINTASRFPKASGDALLALLNAEAVTVASSSYESELSSLLRSLPLSSLALSDAVRALCCCLVVYSEICDIDETPHIRSWPASKLPHWTNSRRQRSEMKRL